MKVTTAPPNKPDVIVTLTHEEAVALKAVVGVAKPNEIIELSIERHRTSVDILHDMCRTLHSSLARLT